LIIINSFIGAKMAQERGIPGSKMIVIPNGIDTEQFHPDSALRKMQREKLKIAPGSIVIGLIGRLDPAKNHIGFIEAASFLKEKAPQVRFLIAGDGFEEYRQILTQSISENGLIERLLLIPAEVDPVPIYNALDICVSASVGEGFPNVIAEAMACEIPCVVTDVGDSASIVGQTGRVVPVGDARQLADMLLDMVNMEPDERQKLGKTARERIVTQFSVQRMVISTMQEFEKLG
jgi:glycosyltransferase involved in cell wall biosynthesis